ncbi:GNAT family N-acetyltransferase [Telmatobacter bradus]|uniref:GNAT family N-acetyltransferase n=1 Tax=Telmatobacter bradus TaxID=474953 RepID=UPI003B439EE0
MPEKEKIFSSEVRYRLATAEDASRLIPMINAAFAVEEFLEGTRTDPSRLAAAMAKGPILIAESPAGDLLGSLSMELRGKRGYLGMLAVHPAHQKRGLAHLMTDEATRRLREAGCSEAEIVVLNLRTELHPIYRSWGFVADGTEECLCGRTVKDGVEVHGIVMVKQI